MKSKRIYPIHKPLTGTVTIPGSKSVTNRALLFAALTPDTVTLKNPLFSEDTLAMISCLKTLGVKITQSKNSIRVTGNIQMAKNKTYVLNANLSGTTLRFLLPILCVIPGEKILAGEEGLNKRPIRALVAALQSIGANISYLKNENYPPLKIKQSTLTKKTIQVNGSISSQYISALLMLLPLLHGGKIHVSSGLVSEPYVALTIAVMREFNIQVKTHKNYFIVSKDQRYERNNTYYIEGDFSSACYFAALAVLTSSEITLRNINPESIQADRKFFDILKQMGNTVTKNENLITVKGNVLKPVQVDMTDCPDQIQTLAVLAAFAKGKTVVTGIKTLAHKETNRTLAIQNELFKMGIKTTATKNTLTIYGGLPISAEIDTYGDHRMAMSFALAGSKLSGVVIRDPHVVKKTFPDFWSKMDSIRT